MNTAQDEIDAKQNQKARNAIERVIWISISFSIIASICLLYLDRTRDIFAIKFLDIFGFYPERVILGDEPLRVKMVIFVSNMTTMLYLIAHLSVRQPEVIRDKFKRQDRKQILLLFSMFWYILRFWMLYIFCGDDKTMTILTIPSLTIISISMALLSLSTVGGQHSRMRQCG